MKDYPEYLDGNVTRIVSAIVFATVTISIPFPTLDILITVLFVDFAIRYYNPIYSPLSWFSRQMTSNLLKLNPNPQYSPPKRFAILIGLVVTAGIVIFNTIHIFSLALILKGLLILASGLQAFLGYCIGCQIYDLLSKAGVVNRKSHIAKFLQ